jgi:hypothetical protein
MDQGIMTMATVAVMLIVAALALWLLYTVIWNGVRRAMHEFARAHAAAVSPGMSAVVVPDYPPREWFEPATVRRTPRRAPRWHR